MGNIHLVTGFAGHQHVSSADQAVLHSLMFGGGQYVLNHGNNFAASIVTNNQINVLDGDILMQGRHIRLNEATSVDLAIENGTQGYSRNDLIVVRYTKDENTGIEDANLVVIKGTPAASNPDDPAYTSGNMIDDGAILNDMPLYRVQLVGLNISELVPLFDAVDIGLINHASRHASNGDDPITPALIGAAKAEEHTVKHYSTISALGLFDSDFDATDATANLSLFHDAMVSDAEVWLTFTGTTNFAKSIHAKLKEDLGIDTNSYVELKLQRNTGALTEVRVVLQYYHSSLTDQPCDREYSCVFRKPNSGDPHLSKFCVTRDPYGFVSNSGGNLTGGALGLAGGKVQWLNNGNGYLQLSHYTKAGDDSNAAHILMAHPKHSTQGGLDKVLRLGYRTDGGTEQYFPILHTGNIRSLYPAPNVVTGSYVGTGTTVVNIAFETPPKMLFVTGTVTLNTVVHPVLILWAQGTDQMRIIRSEEILTAFGNWIDSSSEFAISHPNVGDTLFNQTGVTYTYTAIC